jgi:hypothetical protein
MGFLAQTNESTSYKDALAQSDFSNWKSTMDFKYYSIIKHRFWFLALWINPWLSDLPWVNQDLTLGFSGLRPVWLLGL